MKAVVTVRKSIHNFHTFKVSIPDEELKDLSEMERIRCLEEAAEGMAWSERDWRGGGVEYETLSYDVTSDYGHEAETVKAVVDTLMEG